MNETHLKQPGFTHSLCKTFTECKEYKNLKQMVILNIFIKMN